MNIFQKIKLNKILEQPKNIIGKNYDSYPDYIKSDEEVIKKILRYSFEKIDSDILINFLKRNPQYINDVITEDITHLFVEIPELIKYIKPENYYVLFDVARETDILLTLEQFENLSDTEKITLINKNKEYFYYGDNKKLLEKINSEIQLKLYNEDNSLFNLLSFECKQEVVKNNKSLIVLLSDEEKLMFIIEDESYLELFDDPKIVCQYLELVELHTGINSSAEIISKRKEGFNILYNRGYISMMNNSYYLLIAGLQNRLSDFPNLIKIINKIFTNSGKFLINRNDSGIERSFPLNIKEITAFLNDDILAQNSEYDLMEYFNNPTSFNFKKIIVNAYGQEVLQIFNDRPNINLDMVEDPKIFDKRIIENLGINFVNQVLNYRIPNLNYFIHSILENDFLMNNFKNLYYYIVAVIGEGIESIDLAVKKFVNLKELLKNNQIMDLLIDNEEIMKFILFDELYSFNFKSLEQINNYIDIRSSEIRTNEIGLYTGLNVKDFNSMLSILDGNIDIYGILSDEDMEILQVLKFLRETNDNDKKNKIFNIIDQRHNKFNPLRIHEIYRKVKKVYIYDFNKNITENKNYETCEINYIDGTEIIDFKGESFCFLVSGVNGHTMSSVFNASTNTLKPDELVKNWLELDNGTATISTSLLSEACIVSEGNRRYLNCGGYIDFFGFDNFDDNQILTFKSSDTGASHYPREINQNQDICFSKTYKRIMYEIYQKEGFNGYLTPKSNETVIKRYDSNGKRVLPNFVLVYDDDEFQLKRAIEIVRQFRLLGHKVKIYRINTKYYANKTCGDDVRYQESPRVINTELLDEISKIINGDDEKTI